MLHIKHPDPADSLDTGTDLFGKPLIQTSVVDGQHVEVLPVSHVTHGGPIEFVISGQTEDFIDAKNSFLYIKAKVTNADESDLAADADVGPVNLWFHSLFSQVEVFLNDTMITTSENTYAYKSIMNAILLTDRDSKQDLLSTQMYFKDTAGHMESRDAANNQGFGSRKEKIARSREVEMMGQLNVDLFLQDRLLPPGVDFKIRLIPSKASFNLMCANQANQEFKSIITQASLFVRKVKLNPAVSLAIEKVLDRGITAKYPFKRQAMKVFSIPQGQLSHTQDNLFLGQNPTRLFISMVDTEAYNGLWDKNPFHFKTHHVNYVGLYLDGKQIPAKALTPNFENGHYLRSYFGLMMSLGITPSCTSNAGSNFIDYTDFANGYTIYGYDLSPNLLDEIQTEISKSGVLRIELRFSEALPRPVNVLCLGVLDSMIEIDKSRQVITDFTT